jgi:hypothetical protein
MHGVGHVSHIELQKERTDRRIAIGDRDKRASRAKRGYFWEYIFRARVKRAKGKEGCF